MVCRSVKDAVGTLHIHPTNVLPINELQGMLPVAQTQLMQDVIHHGKMYTEISDEFF